MATFLLKTEPGDYSIEDLKRDRTTVWDGVSNNAALKHIRSVHHGDEALIYHTGAEKRIVGLATICSEPYPDPERDEERLVVFDIRYKKMARTPLSLADIKADAKFSDYALVRQPRLSVMPVPKAIDAALRKMSGL